MFVRPFRYERAASVEEACDLLRRTGGGGKLLAGGQSLLPLLNLGIIDLDAVVDISGIERLSGLSEDNGALVIGALTTHRTIERSSLVARRQPLLAEALRHVGSTRVRNRGTIGGSLAHNDPAAELPLVMAVAGAENTVANGRDDRRVPADLFPAGPFSTVLGDDEMVTSVRVRALGPGDGWAFEEVSRRRGDFALVAAAAVARCSGEKIHELRVGLTGVGDGPVRLRSIEETAVGRTPGEVSAELAEAPLELDPPSDVNATGEYRRHLARVLAGRVVVNACRRSIPAS